MLSWPQVSWSFRTRHLRSQLPCSQGELPRGSMDGSPLLEKTPSGFVLSCHPLFSSQALSPSFPTPPPRSQNGTEDNSQGSSRAVGSVLCLDTHPSLHLLSWLQLGGPGGHGWAGCLGLGGGQGCWPELAWRSHSSPGKAENRRPLCPGVLAATSLTLLPLQSSPPSSPSSVFPLCSVLVPLCLLHLPLLSEEP